MSYPGHSAEMLSVYSTAPADCIEKILGEIHLNLKGQL